MLKMCDLPSGCLPSLSTPDLVSSFPICPRESVEHTGLECYYCRLVQLWKIPRLSDFMESMSNYIGSVQPDGLEVLAISREISKRCGYNINKLVREAKHPVVAIRRTKQRQGYHC